VNYKFKQKSIPVIISYLLLTITALPQEFRVFELGKKIEYFPLSELNTYDWEGYLWVKYRAQVYEYDDDNNLISVTFQRRKKSTLHNWSKLEFNYDSNDNPIEIKVFQYTDQLWEQVKKTKIIYDQNTYLSQEIVYDLEDSGLVLKSVCDYYYDSNGNLVQGLEQSWLDSTYKNYERWIHIYDSTNTLNLSKTQIWKDSNWVDKSRTLIDNNKNEKQRYILSPFGGASTGSDEKIRFLQKYDDNGRVYEEFASFWQDSAWIEASKWISHYNSKDRITEKIWFIKGTEVWSKRTKMEYIYQQ